ncbi:MAG: amidoligase family protein [Lachnospiraceae bacterium]|nr:amidoligase family protein [Lachnospiraceae bacterium]
MSELLKNQRFGVEVEFTGITRKMAADAVAEVLGRRASAQAGGPYYTRKIKDRVGREWKVMRDSSIEPKRKVGEEMLDEYRVEFVTPPLNYEDIETLQTIIRKLREIGGVADKSCGIHIHVDGANHNADSLKRLVNFMVARQDLIYDALNNNDRKGRWCRPLSSELLTAMKKERNLTIAKTEQIWYSPDNDGYLSGVDHSHYNPTRYHGLNLHSFFSKGTVEFRLFNSTLHAGRIKAYIQFCLALSAWSIESTDKVVFRSMSGYTADKEVTLMYNVLTNRLGLGGGEFRTCRYHMMRNLRTNADHAQAA